LKAINWTTGYRFSAILKNTHSLRAFFFDMFERKQNNIFTVYPTGLPDGEYEIEIYVINEEKEGFLVYKG
jgi:hypothetical protein